jgi:hypothetical protein
MQVRITHNTLHLNNFLIALLLNSHVHVCINFTSICYQHRRHSSGQPLRPQSHSSSNNPIAPTRPPSISINPCASRSQNSIQLPSRSPSPTLLSHFTHYHNNCRPSQTPNLDLPSLANLLSLPQTLSRGSMPMNESHVRLPELSPVAPPDLGNVARIYLRSLL